MANIEHIKRLCQGVTVWNRYRQEHPCSADLSHIEIRHARLTDGQFQDVDFDGAIFSYVDLSRSSLDCSRLNGVTVSNTSFNSASLFRAELKGADFKRTGLIGADLRETLAFDLKIRHSNLHHCRFDGAQLRFAHFYNCDMTDTNLYAASLEHVILKRDVLDADTIIRLEAMGCGIELGNLPTRSEWVDWKHFTVKPGDEFGVIVYKGQAWWISDGRWDFFISHASPDKDEVARPLADALRQRGQQVWFDDFEVRPGDSLSKVIDFGTRASLFGIVIISPHFFGRKWTEAELDALSGKRLFLLLHHITAEELQGLRPELEDRITISTDMGIDKIADALIAAIRQPPHV